MSDEKLTLHVAPPKHHVHFFISYYSFIGVPFTLDKTENSHEDTLHVHFTLLPRKGSEFVKVFDASCQHDRQWWVQPKQIRHWLSPGKIDLLLHNFVITIHKIVHGKAKFSHVTEYDPPEIVIQSFFLHFKNLIIFLTDYLPRTTDVIPDHFRPTN